MDYTGDQKILQVAGDIWNWLSDDWIPFLNSNQGGDQEEVLEGGKGIESKDVETDPTEWWFA